MLWFCHFPAERARQKTFWEDLSRKVKAGPKVWVCLGDFNDVVCQDEKRGGRPVSNKANFFSRKFYL